MLNQNHSYNTRAAAYPFLDIPQVKTTHFGQYSVKFQASKTWNKLQRTQNLTLLTSAPSEFKKTLFQIYLAKYSNITQSNLSFIKYCNFFIFYFTFFMSLMSSLLVTISQITSMIIILLNMLITVTVPIFAAILIAIVVVNAIIIIYLFIFIFICNVTNNVYRCLTVLLTDWSHMSLYLKVVDYHYYYHFGCNHY